MYVSFGTEPLTPIQEQKKVGNGGTPRGSWDNLTDQVTFTNENSKVRSWGFPPGQ